MSYSKCQGQATPWGRAQNVGAIERGVRWFSTPSHGGLGVARGAAEKHLSSAARRLGDFMGGYFFYEEDCACAIPFYEHPEWAQHLGFHSKKEELESSIRRDYPEYFEMIDDGTPAPPRLRVGMKVRFLTESHFGGWTLREGDIVEVTKVTGSSINFEAEGITFRCPLGWYYGHGYHAKRRLEAA